MMKNGHRFRGFMVGGSSGGISLSPYSDPILYYDFPLHLNQTNPIAGETMSSGHSWGGNIFKRNAGFDGSSEHGYVDVVAIADQYSCGLYKPQFNTNRIGPFTRSDKSVRASLDGYGMAVEGGTTVRLYRLDNGSMTQLATTGTAPDMTEGLYPLWQCLKSVGNTHEAFILDTVTPELSVVDSTYPTGVPGIWIANGSNYPTTMFIGGSL